MAWIPPTIDDFMTRFPEFAGYDTALVQMILDDTVMRIDRGNWVEMDKTPAALDLTAHRLATTPGAAPSFDEGGGSGGGSSGGSFATGAVKKRKVGDVEVEFETRSDYTSASGGGGGGANAGLLSDFYLTPYGRHYLYIMKLNFPGVAVVYQ
jgi:hypothetical protein